MNFSLRQLVISLVALLVAVAVLVGFVRNPAFLGSQPLILRALVLNFSIFSALVAVFPLNPLFKDRPGTYGMVVCLPALAPVFVYFLLLFPQQSEGGIAAEHLRSELITEASTLNPVPGTLPRTALNKASAPSSSVMRRNTLTYSV